MSQEKIDHLIGRVRELFGEESTSPAQQRLLEQLQRHAHPAETPDPQVPGPRETLEIMLDEFEEDHPQVAAVIRETISALKNMGI